jgi:neutral amino acid transport system permease protein
MQALYLGGVRRAGRHRCALAIGTSSDSPRTSTHRRQTFFAYAALILGGAARVFGPVVGAMAILVRRAQRSPTSLLRQQANGTGSPPSR